MSIPSLRRVLVLGSGAREHALARALLRGAPALEVLVAPGNGGTQGTKLRSIAVDISDNEAVVALARREAIDLVVVGPEGPLTSGVVDALAAANILAFGPTRAAAELEGSKVFMKELISSAGITTAPFHVARTMAEAERAIDALGGAPVVVKADGLCAGKGVVVAGSRDEAVEAARSMLEERVFGDAGSALVIEACISGREVSVHAITDGERFVLLPPARDHKRAYDGDRGPNTGGMGVICPAPDVDAALMDRVGREIIEPTLTAMRSRGRPFRGVLFAGLMVTPEGEPFLLEHNVRFGDPECEAMMELVDGNLAGILAGAAAGALDPASVNVARDRHVAVVVMAAAGYPAAPRKGDRIEGIAAAERETGAVVFHAGTRLGEGGAVFTAGGRVLAVTAQDATLEAARERAYIAAAIVSFDGAHYRTDIGVAR